MIIELTEKEQQIIVKALESYQENLQLDDFDSFEEYDEEDESIDNLLEKL